VALTIHPHLAPELKKQTFIFNDESTGSCICTIITCATADCLCLYLCSPTPPTTRSQTCGYVTRVAVNVSGVTSVLHELRDLAKVTRKSSAKTYTCQKEQSYNSAPLCVFMACCKVKFTFLGVRLSSKC
jgi:hypothetical protein